MTTVAQARAELLLRKKDLSDVGVDVFLQWCNKVNNFARNILVGEDPESLLSEETISVLTDTSSYTLPSDFEHINTLGAGLYYVDDNSLTTDRKKALTGIGAGETGYYLSSTSVVLTPVPASTDTLTFRYVPLLTQLSGDDSELVIPSRFIDYTVNALDVCYTIWDEDKNSEIFADQRFIRSLDEFASMINRAPDIVSLNPTGNY